MTTQNNLQEEEGKLKENNYIIEKKDSPEKTTNTEKGLLTSENLELETPSKNIEHPIKHTEKKVLGHSESKEEPNNNEKKTNQEKSINYEDLTLESLINEFGKLLNNEDFYNVRPRIISIKKVFNQKFSVILNKKMKTFLAEGGNSIDFNFDSPQKKEFNDLSKIYRKKNEEFENKKTKNLKQNLDLRLQIIEEIKALTNISQNSNATYNKFKGLQEQWKNIGRVPVENANDVWNNYRHHVEKYYDFLHLDRDLRERDYKHNLEKKQKLIKSVENLANEENLGRAFRELNAIHKIWKEELGPVAKEHRDALWEQFSAATKIINDKRKEFNAHIEQELMVNYTAKLNVIEKIKSLTNKENSSHNNWQNKVKEVETLREDFFNTGAVPKKLRNKSWTDFKSAVRAFNKIKNNFYKDLKKAQIENLKRKKELVEVAIQNKDSEDFETTAALMKKIQNQWKKIGHTSKKDSSKMWKEFLGACDHFFERYHEQKNAGSHQEIENLTQKKRLLDEINSYKVGEDHEAALIAIKGFSKQWNAVGKVPNNKRQIERDFFKTLSRLFSIVGVNEEELKSLKYTNKIQGLSKDSGALNNEISFVRKKIDEIKSDVNQLENNLQFFSNVADDNPLVSDVHKKIEKHKAQLKQWTKKLSIIKKIINN